MKNIHRILWGILCILAGGVLIANAAGWTSVDLFFDGWWTLLIILPSAFGLFTARSKMSCLIGLIFGTLLLLCYQKVLPFATFWKLILPILLVLIGVKLVCSTLFHNSGTALFKRIKAEGRPIHRGAAVFSGQDMHLAGECVEALEVSAVFGGLSCDLREASITQDCVIRATGFCGGIDLLVPPNVTVKVSSTSVFGGVDNRVAAQHGEVTLYVTATCIFGGIDIR